MLTFISGVYYYCYEALKKILTKDGQRPFTTGQSMIAGSIAGTAVVFATHPIWTVNVKMFQSWQC